MPGFSVVYRQLTSWVKPNLRPITLIPKISSLPTSWALINVGN